MAARRTLHTATLLRDGTVMVVGGTSPDGDSCVASAELYRPATGRWLPVGSMRAARSFHTATLLSDGRALIAGGMTGVRGAGATTTALTEMFQQ